MGYRQVIFTMSPIIMSTVMYFEDQIRFKRFTQLILPKFNGVLEEDAYEFLIYYIKKFHNLRLLESYGGTFTIYLLRGITRG